MIRIPTLSFSLAPVLALGLAGCAHTDYAVDRFEYSPATNSVDVIETLEHEAAQARDEQIDILSPDHYHVALEHLADAKAAQETGVPNYVILDRLGYARAHLDAAMQVGAVAREAIPEVLEARDEAIRSQAKARYAREFNRIDTDLVYSTIAFEKGKRTMAEPDRSALRNRYLQLEKQAANYPNQGSPVDAIGSLQ